MARFIAECAVFVVGLAAFTNIIVPPLDRSRNSLTFAEKVVQHPFATVVVLLAWGTVAGLTIREVRKSIRKNRTGEGAG